MKANLLSILVGLLVVIGCKPDNYKDPHQDTSATRYELDNDTEYYDKNYKVFTLEGCEYILVGVGNTRWGSHKGNCKNSIHKENASN
jgi:hypothetical protein